MRGSRLPHAQFSLQYLKFSLRYTMGNMFGMFSFAFWVIWALKCEAVNFIKLKLAGIPIRPFEYLDVPILFIAYDANHVTMTSPAFAFHLCHVQMRWHDVISVVL